MTGVQKSGIPPEPSAPPEHEMVPLDTTLLTSSSYQPPVAVTTGGSLPGHKVMQILGTDHLPDKNEISPAQRDMMARSSFPTLPHWGVLLAIALAITAIAIVVLTQVQSGSAAAQPVTPPPTGPVIL